MPFCIIFFVISILWCIFYKINLRTNLVIISTSILGVLAVFVGNIRIASNIYFNIFLAVLFLFLVVGNLFWMRPKINMVCFASALLISFVYIIMLQSNLYLSIDYGVLWIVLPAGIIQLFVATKIENVFLFSAYSLVGITVVDSLFWWKELQYIDINTISVLNILAMLLLIGFTSLCFRRILRKKDGVYDVVA